MSEDTAQRSKTMRAVKSKDTLPELKVRKLLYSMGYRYRLHRKDLPGKPDIVFVAKHKLIFVHGCFWHGHNCKRGSRQPITNKEYWKNKITRNIERFAQQLLLLEAAEWSVMTVWECELKNMDELKRRLQLFIDGPLGIQRPKIS